MPTLSKRQNLANHTGHGSTYVRRRLWSEEDAQDEAREDISAELDALVLVGKIAAWAAFASAIRLRIVRGLGTSTEGGGSMMTVRGLGIALKGKGAGDTETAGDF